jgi:hypothetical protein
METEVLTQIGIGIGVTIWTCCLLCCIVTYCKRRGGMLDHSVSPV